MKSKIFLLVGTVALLFVACKKEDPAEKVYLQKTVNHITQGSLQTTVTDEFVWEEGLLVKERTTTVLFGVSLDANTYFEYEGTNVVKSYIVDSYGDTSSLNNFTYENGRLKSFDFSGYTGMVTGYTSNGEISSFELTMTEYVEKYELEWKDGDVVKSKRIKVLSDGTEEEESFEYTYDDKPSMYSHMPIIMGLDSDYAMALRASKHNMIQSDYTVEYKNNRLVKRVKDDGSEDCSIYYTDGVGPDAK